MKNEKAEIQDRAVTFAAKNQDQLIEAIERRQTSLDNPGFCVECGEERDGCEPDVRQYPCESCGCSSSVYAPEELLFLI